MPTVPTEFPHRVGLTSSLMTLSRSCIGILRQIALVAAPPVARVALALPFLRSGLTRWDGFLALSPSTSYLFEEVFRLHILGGEYPIPFGALVAYVVAFAEIILPMLLLLGFGTRLAALALLLMTGVIQLVTPDGWANFHLYWAALSLSIMAIGSGPLALDRLLQRALGHRATRQQQHK